MDRTDTMINDISVILRTAGESLAKNPEDLSPVRRMQQKLVGLPSTALDPHVRFLTFFLSCFIDDLYYNLVGDIPPNQQSEEIGRAFFRYFGEILKELGGYLVEETHEQCYAGYVRLVSMYVKTIDELCALEGM